MSLSFDEQVDVKGRGRLRLQPLPGSTVREVLDVEIDLHHREDALTLGDLKVAARRHASEGNHEHAYRLWTAVGQAAERHRYPALITAAKANAEGEKVRAKTAEGQAEGQKVRAKSAERRDRPRAQATRYDYDLLAADVDNGDSRADVAARHGCAVSTVARAVEYVAVRDELLDESPELFDQLMAGVDVIEVARRYGVSPKIVRWLVRTEYDRRGNR